MSGILPDPNPIAFKNPVVVLTRTWLAVIVALICSNIFLVGSLVYVLKPVAEAEKAKEAEEARRIQEDAEALRAGVGKPRLQGKGGVAKQSSSKKSGRKKSKRKVSPVVLLHIITFRLQQRCRKIASRSSPA